MQIRGSCAEFSLQGSRHGEEEEKGERPANLYNVEAGEFVLIDLRNGMES